MASYCILRSGSKKRKGARAEVVIIYDNVGWQSPFNPCTYDSLLSVFFFAPGQTRFLLNAANGVGHEQE